MRSRVDSPWWIFAALLLAVPAGLLTEPGTWIGGVRPYAAYDFLGTLFLRGLKMLVVPLILSAVIHAVSGMGAGVGKLGAKALGFFLLSSFLAVLTGLFWINVMDPGLVDGVPARELVGLSSTPDQVSALVGASRVDLSGLFLRMVPENVAAAAAQADMLALIVFAVLFGLALSRLPEAARESQRGFWKGVHDAMLVLTRWVMFFAPLGVFGLVARSLSASGPEAFGPLAGFFLTVLLALATHLFVTLPLLLVVLGKVNPWRHLKAMSEALLTAFTTSSSNATLPKTLECLEKRAGVPAKVSGFVTPLGASLNMDGTALYECAAALFIAQCYGLDLSFGVQFSVVAIALLSSTGVAGIPSASLVAIATILAAIGLPVEGLGIILAVDRLLDMCRTAVNVYSDSCASAILARGFKDGVTPA
jgi:Na+/H+-dicarboxylate symporter